MSREKTGKGFLRVWHTHTHYHMAALHGGAGERQGERPPAKRRRRLLAVSGGDEAGAGGEVPLRHFD